MTQITPRSRPHPENLSVNITYFGVYIFFTSRAALRLVFLRPKMVHQDGREVPCLDSVCTSPQILICVGILGVHHVLRQNNLSFSSIVSVGASDALM